MLFGDDSYIKLEYDIHYVEYGDKLILIKKQDYMNKDYIDFLIKSLVDIQAADKISYNANIKAKILGRGIGDFIGILLHTPAVKDYLIGVILSTITTQFLDSKLTENSYKSNAYNNYIEYHPVEGNLHNTSFNDVNYVSELIDPDFFDYLSGKYVENKVIKEDTYMEDTNFKGEPPDYITDYPVCPNIAIKTLQETYIEMYKNLVKLKVFAKYDIDGGEDYIEKIEKAERVLEGLDNEILEISHFEMDCNLCKGDCEENEDLDKPK